MLYYEVINHKMSPLLNALWGYILVPENHVLFTFNDNIVPAKIYGTIGNQEEILDDSVCRDFVYFCRFIGELFPCCIDYVDYNDSLNLKGNLGYEKKYVVLGFNTFSADFDIIQWPREKIIDKCRNIARILDNPIFYDDTISITENIFDEVLSYEDFCRKFKYQLTVHEYKNKKVIKIIK